MKSQKNIQKLYEDTLASVETAKDVCTNCGSRLKEHHKNTVGDGFCVQGEYSRRFTINTLAIAAIAALEKQVSTLKWVLDQEETYVSIDDCIMPETIVASFTKKKSKEGKQIDFPLEFAVNVDDLDPPYREILLASSNKLPITLPGVIPEVVQVVSFAIFPSGSVFRNYNEIDEELFEKMDKSELKPALIQILNKEMAEELSNRYGGK